MEKDKKRFKLFDTQRVGKGISKKKEIRLGSFGGFFSLYKNNFGKISYINLFYVLGNFPIIFFILTLSGYTKNASLMPFYDIFQNVNSIISIEGISPASMTMLASFGIQNNVMIPSVLTYVFYGISLLTLFTFGIVNAGTAYALRNVAMGDPVFVWSDFWYAVKRNWKQALPFGIIDGLINMLLVYNIYTNLAASNFMLSLMFWCNIILFLIYYCMRFYIYVQMVTFKLSIFKIIKNSLIFFFLGMKRNLLALLGSLLIFFLEIIFLFGSGGFFFALGLMLPLMIMISTAAFMKVYASYYKIKEVIIDPYYEEHPEEKPEPVEAEAIMRDDVTELERLEEIKRRNGIQ